MAGDGALIAPDVYKVILENDRVRVLDTRTKPGATSQMHGHPDMVGYAITACTWGLTGPDGETVRVEIPAGETFYLDAVEHSATDIGTTGSHALLIELK
ncbi:MAG: cytoplasmic protein [Chloroflexi bacterium]|nr:cytoplasmic protein [Chloroflexota bacterium]